MPAGVETYVDGGFATVDFVDPALRGPALGRLIELGGSESIEVITREGPRRKYRVPEGNARSVGLIDSPVDATAAGDTSYAADLAAADPNGPGVSRPVMPTSDESNASLPVPQADVLGNTSVLTSPEPTDNAPSGAVRPHAELVAQMRDKADEKRATVAERKAELDAEKPPTASAGALNASLAVQTGALATDPQARGEGPSMDWTRREINAHAADQGIDTTGAPNKQAALAQIQGEKT
jgi:hypothetical protein